MDLRMTILLNQAEKFTFRYNSDTPTEAGEASVSPHSLRLSRSLRLSCLFCFSFKLETRLDFPDECVGKFTVGILGQGSDDLHCRKKGHPPKEMAQ